MSLLLTAQVTASVGQYRCEEINALIVSDLDEERYAVRIWRPLIRIAARRFGRMQYE